MQDALLPRGLHCGARPAAELRNPVPKCMSPNSGDPGGPPKSYALGAERDCSASPAEESSDQRSKEPGSILEKLQGLPATNYIIAKNSLTS
ncbi:hypothetical protein GW7_06514 [Heterocephalus glaber]|uniref:Uncharacterized protein n=1 Tax=Heterocephalus glaber TaxID=10181 RepID=G5ALF2_HETGA|nr:hypothetical protein GW7_06514 [Heterocephalus glaber]